MKLNFLLGCVSAFVLASSAFADLELKEKGDLRDSDKVVVGGNIDKVIIPTTSAVYSGFARKYGCDQLIAFDEPLEQGGFAFTGNYAEWIFPVENVYGIQTRWFLMTETIAGFKFGYVVWITSGAGGKHYINWSGAKSLEADGTIGTVTGGKWTDDGQAELGTLVELLDGGSDPDLEDYYFYAGHKASFGLPHKSQSETNADTDSRIVAKVTKEFVEALGVSASAGGVDEEAVNALIDAKLAPEKFKQAAGAAMNTIYDEALGVTWKATMINGSLYYSAIVNEDATAIK